MSEEAPSKLKVVSSGSQDPNVIGLRTIGTIGLCIVTVLVVVYVGPQHLWRMVGPGSSAYRQCLTLLEAEHPNFELQSSTAQRHGERWEFRFTLTLLTYDNSPGGEAVRRCSGSSAGVALEGY